MRTDDASWTTGSAVETGTVDGAMTPTAAPERISYSFGTGEGAPTTWNDAADHDADGDGTADSVALDFDGDGRVDDAMWDSDGDGVADTALLDLDDDGRADHGYSDPTGLGTWNGKGAPLPGQNATPPPPEPTDDIGWTDRAGGRHADSLTEDLDGDGRDDAAWVDFDGDGTADELVVDADHDGAVDQLLVDVDGDGRNESAYLDSDGDAEFDTMLVDDDGDGTVDHTHRSGDAEFIDP